MDKLGVFLCTGCGIGDALDVDVDGDDVNDALSAGFRVGFATCTEGMAHDQR